MSDLKYRLRCRYPIGPMKDGEPEFGWRDFSGPAPEGMKLPSSIMLEAANEIERLNLLLSPRFWTQQMSEAWHRNIPDTQKAFDELKKCSN